MEFTSTMQDSYWVTEYQRDISKLNKQIDYYKELIESEKNQPKPRLRKVFMWSEEVQNKQSLIDSRKKSIDRINNK
tara:strand:+ start:408 stop:635 length:228 start_codon:yes stop_codon:yes gene_type:complete